MFCSIWSRNPRLRSLECLSFASRVYMCSANSEAERDKRCLAKSQGKETWRGRMCICMYKPRAIGSGSERCLERGGHKPLDTPVVSRDAWMGSHSPFSLNSIRSGQRQEVQYLLSPLHIHTHKQTDTETHFSHFSPLLPDCATQQLSQHGQDTQ